MLPYENKAPAPGWLLVIGAFAIAVIFMFSLYLDKKALDCSGRDDCIMCSSLLPMPARVEKLMKESK